MLGDVDEWVLLFIPCIRCPSMCGEVVDIHVGYGFLRLRFVCVCVCVCVLGGGV